MFTLYSIMKVSMSDLEALEALNKLVKDADNALSDLKMLQGSWEHDCDEQKSFDSSCLEKLTPIVEGLLEEAFDAYENHR